MTKDIEKPRICKIGSWVLKFCTNGNIRLIINRQSCMIINEYFVLKWKHITSQKGTWVWQTLMRKN